jgi:hypothetical protein
MLLLLLAAQSAIPAASPAAAPTSFSILQPVPDEPCVRRGAKDSNPEDIVVCGQPLPSQALPYPNEVVLDEPRPSNPDLRATRALDLSTPSCATVQSGCNVGVNIFGGATQLVRLVQKAIAPDSCCERPGEASSLGMLLVDAAHWVGRAFRKKPDKSRRVSIPLEDPPLDTSSRITP